ncbi:MAG: TSUP family transporter [Vicinamibacteria bacterium]
MTSMEWLTAEIIVLVGSVLQGAVGFGLGLLGAPLLVLLDPALVPGPLLAAALFLTVLMCFREHETIDFRGVGWALAGRVPGTIIGATVLALVPRQEISLLVGAMVLLAVAMFASGADISRTPHSLFGAGTLSGFMATTASIGGPALAILYQDSRGDRVRGTLAGFFLAGLVLSLSALAVVGRFGPLELRASILLLPAVLLGFLLSRRIARSLDRGHTRAAILVSSAVAGLVVIAEALVSYL